MCIRDRIEEDLDVEKLPEIWADKYEEYLGVRPENPAEGVLQDIHWSQSPAHTAFSRRRPKKPRVISFYNRPV